MIKTKCNNGLHGSLSRDYNNKWWCLWCKEGIDYLELMEFTKNQRSMMETLKAAGYNVVIEQYKMPDDKSKIAIVDDNEQLERGVIKSVGHMVNFMESDIFKTGDNVIYPKGKAKKVGLNFPSNLVVVNVEDICAYVEKVDVK